MSSSNCTHNRYQQRRRRRRRRRRIAALLFAALLSLLTTTTCCQAADPVALTDKTFDHVREAFGHPDMLILTHHSSSSSTRDDIPAKNDKSNVLDRKALDEFHKLSNDQLLQDKGIMLVTVDVSNNRMLATRMGLLVNEQLPSLVFLYGDSIYQYQNDPTSSALMRSYALQGYTNQGSGEPMLNASYWLLIKVAYLNWLFNNGGGGDEDTSGNYDAGSVNFSALLCSGFVVGLLCCGVVAIIVSLRFGGEEVLDTTPNKKEQ